MKSSTFDPGLTVPRLPYAVTSANISGEEEILTSDVKKSAIGYGSWFYICV